ncbi:ATP-binding protein [Streptomyces sp. NPDC001514]
MYLAAGDIHYHAPHPSPKPPAAVRALPPDVAEFTGRSAELAQLIEVDVRARVLAVYAVDGMAGVGKTALVTRAAHLLEHHFPDGQVFVRLHAHTPGRQPVDPSEILADLLTNSGIPPQLIPVSLDARAAMWRDRLADRKVLLILDDAASRSQIEPLLPASKDARVLITSRRLLALPGATLLPLGILPPEQAAQLFVRLSRRSPTASEADAVGDIVSHCGYLPLAITLLAARLAHRQKCSISQFAAEFAEFAEAQDRLEAFEAEELPVATAFALSYRDLTADQKHLFRRIGLHPGSDIDAYAAAALDNILLGSARRQLSALYTYRLLDEPAPGRYRMHDLVREYARNLAAQDHAEDCQSATDRLLTHFCQAAESANRHLGRRPRPGAPALSTRPPAAPALATRDDALAWMRTERSNLIACIHHAGVSNRHSHVVQLTGAMAAFLHQEGPWPEAAVLHRNAAVAAHHNADLLGEANSLFDFAVAQHLTGDYRSATEALERALTLYRTRSPLGEAGALSELGTVRRLTRDHEVAQQLQEQALVIYRNCSDRQGEADTLQELGRLRFQTGDHRALADLMSEALEIYHLVGDHRGEARAFHGLGAAEYQKGNHAAASTLFQQALELSRAFGFRLIEANTLFDLSHVRYRTGDSPAAIELLERAVELYRDLGFTLGEANAAYDLGILHHLTDEYPTAVALLERAVKLYRKLGSGIVECNALYDVGRLRYRIGDRAGAVAALEEALTQYRDLGHTEWEAEVRSAMGTLLAQPAGPHMARALYERAAHAPAQPDGFPGSGLGS